MYLGGKAIEQFKKLYKVNIPLRIIALKMGMLPIEAYKMKILIEGFKRRAKLKKKVVKRKR